MSNCLICKGLVPPEMPNQFYCTEEHRREGWRLNNPGVPEPDWDAVNKDIDALGQLTKASKHLRTLEVAAMQLCCVLSTTHSIECACEACQAACEVVPYLPTMSTFHKAQFERRIAVQAVAKEQREKGKRYE